MNQRIPTPMDMNPTKPAVDDDAIDEAVERVEGLGTEVISEHVAAFEHAHRVLQDHLNEAVDG